MKKYVKSLNIIKNGFAVIVGLLLIISMADLTLAAKRGDKQYVAKQISNIKIDGDISEWERAEAVAFDQLKDAGAALPNADDFTGKGRVAWSAKDPTRIYFLVEITDDKLQDIHPEDDKWWEDDSVEFMFDFDNEVTEPALVQWTLGANGLDVSAAASPDNTEWALSRNFNDYIYEVAIDPTARRGPNPGNADKGKNFKAKHGLTIGFSFHMNDCENGVREHQIGWIAGRAWDPLNFGDLTFDRASLDVEPSGKLALTWAALKQ